MAGVPSLVVAQPFPPAVRLTLCCLCLPQVTCDDDTLDALQQDFTFVALMRTDGVSVTLSCAQGQRRRLAAGGGCGGDGPAMGFDLAVSVPLNGSKTQLLSSGAGGNAAAAVFQQFQNWQASPDAAAALVCGPADASQVKVVATQVGCKARLGCTLAKTEGLRPARHASHTCVVRTAANEL